MTNILIIGATSAIAAAVAERFAARGAALYLMARNQERLAALATHLRRQGAQAVHTAPFEAADVESYGASLRQARAVLGSIGVALIAHGLLDDTEASERRPEHVQEIVHTNATSPILLSMLLASQFEQQRHGTLAVITSVAADRGRYSHYVYASAKAATSVFLQGLRVRLCASGVRVLTIKPGYVDTPMTAAFRKGPLWASPQRVAAGIDRAIASGRSGELYLPWFWWWIMLIIRHMPGRLLAVLRI